MGLFSIFGRKVPETAAEERAETAVLEAPKISMTAAELMAAGLWGEKPNDSMVMQIPMAARCVIMIAGAVAMLPVRLYRKENGRVSEIIDDPRVRMLNGKTGDTINADEMRYMMVKDHLLGGGGYAYIVRRNGMPVGLKYINRRYVSVNKNAVDVINKTYVYNVNGRSIFPHEMLKILRFTDGFGGGTGVVDEQPLLFEFAYNMLKFQRNQLLKGGNKRGFIKAEKQLTKDAMNEIRSAWNNLYGNTNEERVVFLNNGIDFKEVSSTSVEMQINQNMKTADEEIMRLFGTADGLLSDDTVKNAVMPVLDIFEAAFDADLLLEDEKDSMYFAFDTRELTRGDVSKRYQAYATALSHNFMQLDEVRALEDLPPLNVNFIKLGLQDVLLDPKTGKIYTPNTNQFQNFGNEVLTSKPEEGIIEERGNPYHAKDGKFTFGKVKMSKTEYIRVSSAICTDHPNYKNESTHVYEFGEYFYAFTVIEPGTYNYFLRIKISNKNKKRINLMRSMIDD